MPLLVLVNPPSHLASHTDHGAHTSCLQSTGHSKVVHTSVSSFSTHTFPPFAGVPGTGDAVRVVIPEAVGLDLSFEQRLRAVHGTHGE